MNNTVYHLQWPNSISTTITSMEIIILYLSAMQLLKIRNLSGHKWQELCLVWQRCLGASGCQIYFRAKCFKSSAGWVNLAASLFLAWWLFFLKIKFYSLSNVSRIVRMSGRVLFKRGGGGGRKCNSSCSWSKQLRTPLSSLFTQP